MSEFEKTDSHDEDSSSESSFHSLAEQVESLDVGENDFVDPNFAKKNMTDFPDQQFDDEPDHVETENKNKYDPFFIDKEYLKDLEVAQSSDEKEIFHQKSLEHKECGNKMFKEAAYETAAMEYTSGLQICPLSFDKTRAILYANRAAARARLKEPDLKECIADCTESVELDATYLRAILRRASFNRKADNLDESLADYKKVLELDPSVTEAREAIVVLPPLIEEKNEKLKTEMLGKLKDLGNMVLKPFGLSTSNFEMKQDANTGGYNIQFNQSGS